MDRLALIEKLFAAYPSTTPSAATFAVYLEVLAEIPLGELNTVVLQCIREGGAFPPAAGQVYERWRTLTAPAQLGVSDAWGMVQSEIRRVGSWGKPEFSDPVVGRVVAQMGWLELCQSENGMADRAHFMRLYGDLLTRNEQLARLSPASRQLADHHRGQLTQVGAFVTGLLPDRSN